MTANHYTIKETAERLNWNEPKVRRWIRRGMLKAVKGYDLGLLNKAYFVPGSEIERVGGVK